MPDPLVIAAIAGAFLIAGTVKGVIGMGLPTVGLGLLAAVFDLPAAMALILVPSALTNIWQAASGGHARGAFARIWPFLLTAGATVWVGGMVLVRTDGTALLALLGGLLGIYGAAGLAGFRLSIGGRQARWLGPALGAVNGVLTGMTGSFAVPGVMYLQALGLPRDELIQAMGMLFAVSTFALAVALGGNGLLSAELGWQSAAAVVPALLGVVTGRAIRGRLSEEAFRRVFFAGLLVLGAWIVGRAVL